MKNQIRNTAMLIGFLYAAPLQAMDFKQAWELALSNDPQYQAARYANQSEQESVDIAKSKLLPNIRLGGSIARNDTEQVILESNQDPINNTYTSERFSLSLSQPLLRMETIYDYRKSNSTAAAAKSIYAYEQQMLATKLANAYFDVMLANERLQQQVQSIEFLKTSLIAAEKSFKHGMGIKTDIEDAKAMLDSAIADEIEAKNTLFVAEQALSKIIGQNASAMRMPAISLDKIPFEIANERSLDDWIQIAQQHNPELAALRYNLESSDHEINRRRAGHLPTLDLVASRSYARSDTDNTIGSQYNTSSIGVQVNIPIYSGGGVEASYRQAAADQEELRYQFDATSKKIELEITKQFSQVEQNSARIRSLLTALKSAEIALEANKKSIYGGTRNIADVLNSEQKLLQVRIKLSEAKYAYVVAVIKLRTSTGVISKEDILNINRWLG